MHQKFFLPATKYAEPIRNITQSKNVLMFAKAETLLAPVAR